MQFNIADLLECVVDTVPERTAVVCGDRRLSYAELDAQANRLAHHLLAQGIGSGDHVGMHLHNSVEYIVGMLATLKIRAVPININYRYVEEELKYLFDNADLVAVIHQKSFSAVVSAAAAQLPRLETFIHVEDGSEALKSHPSVDFEAALAAGKEERGFGPRSSDDQYIIYTGGTTGMPRGVMWRHEDLFFAGLQGGRPGGESIERPEELAEVLREGGGLNIHPAAPLIHGAAQLASWICMFAGGTVGLVPGRSFDPESSCRLISDEEMNVINLVGDAMARPFAEELDRGDYDTSMLVALSSAGAILSDVVKDLLEENLPDAMILNNYGSSETGHQGTAISRKGGQPRFFMHGDCTTVLDDEMKRVEAGSGVIGKLARTGNIPLGYYGDPEKTARTFPVVDGVRYVIPGDMALLEEDGSVTLLGRGAVCINTGGEKVYPEEVEEAFKSHPAVMDVVVVGIPDERWGERVTALVELRQGVEAELSSLEEHVRGKVAGYKTPRQIHVIPSVERHPSGKPDYRWARETSIELCGG